MNPIGNDIRCARDDEFACFRFAAGTTQVRVLGKPFHRGKNALSQSARGRRLILFDVLPDVNKVGDGRLGPDYSHDGADNSRFLPQERNQRAVFS